MPMSSLLLNRYLLAASTLIALGCSIKIGSGDGKSSEPRTSGDEAKEEVEDKPKADKPKPKPEKPKPEKPKPRPKPEKPKPVADKPKEEKPPKEEPKPEPPKETPPAPEAQPEHSKIVLPIRIPLETVQRELEAVLPKTDSKDWTQVTDGDDSPMAEIKYKLWRDPIDLKLEEHTFHVTVPVRYAATIRAQVKNPLNKDWMWIAKDETWGTTQDPQRITAHFEARVRIEDDFRVKSEIKLVKLQHGDPPSGKICKNAGIQICVTKESIAPKVRDGIDKRIEPKLKKALEKLDAQLERYLDLEKRAARVWGTIQKPQLLPGTKDAWLVVRPTAVGVGWPVLDGSDVRVDLAIQGRVSVDSGDKPMLKPEPLPKVIDVKGRPGLHVVAQLRIPAEVLTKTLRRELAGVGIKGRKVELPIKSVQLIAGSDKNDPGQMTLKVELGERLEDAIEVRGKLTFDAAAQRLTLEDLELKVDPKSSLADKAAGFDQGAVRKQLASKAQWNLSDEAEPLKKAIVAALDAKLSGQATVSGELKQIDVRKLEMTKDYLEAEVVLGGRLEIKVTR
jgi:hypothetical protein